MNDEPQKDESLFEKLKGRGVVRVTIAYGAAAFVVLQAADIIFPAIGIPDGGFRALVIATLVGFPIAIVLAWLFQWTPEGLRRTVGSPEEGPVIARLSRRTGALFALAGLAVVSLILVWAWPSSVSGAVADDASVIAVVPFATSGGVDASLGEGLVDLISRNLDEVEGVRLIDPRIVLHRWNESAARGPVTADAEREIGRALGAGSVLTGSLVRLGDQVSVSAELLSLDGAELATASEEGSSDDLLGLVDRLSIDLLRGIWRATSPVPVPALGGVTTDDVEAMRHFLDGERHYRASDWPAALSAYARAVESDEQFAFAYYRLARTFGWVGNAGDGRQSTYTDLALTFGDRLPIRVRRLAVSDRLWLEGERAASIDTLRALTDEYPDDPEAWLRLADNVYHFEDEGAGPLARPVAEQVDAFERALDLDPSFLPAVVHPVEIALRRADADRLDRYIRIIEAAGSRDSAAVEILAAALDMLRDPASGTAATRVFDALMSRAAEAEGLTRQAYIAVRPAALRSAVTLPAAEREPLLASLRERMVSGGDSGDPSRHALVTLLAATGRVGEAAAIADSTPESTALARAARRDPVMAGLAGPDWLEPAAAALDPLEVDVARLAAAGWASDAAAFRAALDRLGDAEGDDPEVARRRRSLAEAGQGILEVLEGDHASGLARAERALDGLSAGPGSPAEPLWSLGLDLSSRHGEGDRALSLLSRPWPGAPAFELRRLASLARALDATGRPAEAEQHRAALEAAIEGADEGARERLR